MGNNKYLSLLLFLVLSSGCISLSGQPDKEESNNGRQKKINDLLEKVEYYTKYDSIPGLIECYNLLASLYYNNSETNKAIQCCRKNMSLVKKYNLKIDARCYFDMGSIYSEWGIYDSAIFYYNKSLELV